MFARIAMVIAGISIVVWFYLAYRFQGTWLERIKVEGVLVLGCVYLLGAVFEPRLALPGAIFIGLALYNLRLRRRLQKPS